MVWHEIFHLSFPLCQISSTGSQRFSQQAHISSVSWRAGRRRRSRDGEGCRQVGRRGEGGSREVGQRRRRCRRRIAAEYGEYQGYEYCGKEGEGGKATMKTSRIWRCTQCSCYFKETSSLMAIRAILCNDFAHDYHQITNDRVIQPIIVIKGSNPYWNDW
jgi:hypothetical protein